MIGEVSSGSAGISVALLVSQLVCIDVLIVEERNFAGKTCAKCPGEKNFHALHTVRLPLTPLWKLLHNRSSTLKSALFHNDMESDNGLGALTWSELR
ncbi:MAG: hypothetical protein NZ954_01500 [Thermofilaceae archaeon]|nr:hypothetical protein [Thermofilaceae archaeon]MCX8180453.1 hypothetical protein [Thermofilaceae archaeon]MDW8003350.1 hypothetical protein [Thermofilaceae archaeon]